jgi:hypothetical protein
MFLKIRILVFFFGESVRLVMERVEREEKKKKKGKVHHVIVLIYHVSLINEYHFELLNQNLNCC